MKTLKTLPMLCALLSTLLCLSAPAAKACPDHAGSPENSIPGQDSSASTADRLVTGVLYRDTVLIVSGPQGVAAFAFGETLPDGVKYRFRFLPKQGQEASGAAEVFEKYTKTPGDKPNTFNLVDAGSQLMLTAGPIQLEWSNSSEHNGWIYHNPQELRLQLARGQALEKLDLKSFMQ